MTRTTLSAALSELEARGHRARAIPIERLDEVREQYERLVAQRLVDEDVGRALLRGSAFGPPETMPEARSLVVVATRDPAVLCTFSWRGAGVCIPVPPTYLHLRRKGREVARKLSELLGDGAHAEPLLNAPHKLLAVRSGLARYGRNNITYIHGLGSFHLLTTVCTDLPCEGGEWSAPAMMPECGSCMLCASACPTGAISDDRFLLRAERCITWWNEKPGDVPFPEWMDGGRHDSVVGCMRCQLSCPMNAGLLEEMNGPNFTEEETGMLLTRADPAELTDALREKLDTWDLLNMLETLPRNLSVHLRRG